jgi:tetratricopeptide (TPR) repeat protein
MGHEARGAEAGREALQLDPASADAALIVSSAANRRGEYDQALRVISDLVARVPAEKNNPLLIFHTAVAELNRSQPKTALALIDAALPQLTAAGLESSAQIIRAQALSALPERSTEAVSAWERVVEIASNPADIDRARENLVNFLLQQAHIAATANRWNDAVLYFEKALTEIPAEAADANERRRAIRMQKVQTLAPYQLDIVLDDLDELDSTWPTPEWPITIDLRITGLTAAGRVAEALNWLEERLARTPALANHPAAHQLRADTQITLGLTDEAMKECQRALELAPTATDVRALVAVLKCAFGSQQFKLAIDAYERLRQLDPAAALDPSVRVIAAFGYLRNGDPQTALNLTDDAHPPTLGMMVLLGACRGEAQVRLGRHDEALATTAEALEHYQAAKSVAPTQVSAVYLVLLHTLRAQTFNEKKEFETARRSASAAIEVPDDPGVVSADMTAFVRISALMQRSLALYSLKKESEAHQDIDEAIKRFERVRNTAFMKFVEQTPGFERFEGALWYAKGSVLDSEKRCEEALAAYTRSERLENHGASAAIARGYALAKTGAFEKALTTFNNALTRAATPQERAEAFTGKGRVLVRLKKFEDAISALQSALDARLTDRSNDPGVFEQLGIAYASLQRNEAAKRAFEIAWDLTPENKRSDNLARGITAAELCLHNPRGVLDFLDTLPAELAKERTLQFNRALALDAVGQRRAAIRCLLAAKELGLARAQAELDRLDAPAGLGRWTHYWFGAQTRPLRQAFGIVLVLIAATGLAAPLFQWWLNEKFDWYLLLLPSVIALVLLALPNMKSIGFEGAGVTLSVEPLSATGRDAAAVAAPESFEAPTLP